MQSIESYASSPETWMAQSMWKADIWLNMMVESFKGADVDRADLTRNGPWTARTKTVQQYARSARFDHYA